MTMVVTMRSLAKRAEQLLVALHPGGGGVLRADQFFHFGGRFQGAMHVVHVQLDLVDHVFSDRNFCAARRLVNAQSSSIS